MTEKRHPLLDSFSQHWLLDPTITYLNHGSFGACPIPVLRKQQELQASLEKEPIRFLDREGESRLDQARASLGEFIGADSFDLAFVPNATSGVNTVLRSLRFKSGDQLMVTDHEYNACRRALDYIADRDGAKIVVVHLPFPLDDDEEIVERILAAASPRTKLALIDHITSPTALVLPIKRIVRELQRLGIDTLVDGAHAPGQVDLNLSEIDAAYYTGNCHKWLCTPKGSAFLHVRRDRQEALHPLVISHGYNTTDAQRGRFRLEFDWTGTADPTAYLCIPEAIGFLGGLYPGGWPALRNRNHELALQGRKLLCEKLSIEPPCPKNMVGSMASLPLPPRREGVAVDYRTFDPLQNALMDRYRIEVPVIDWPKPRQRVIRISAQAYNSLPQYELLADALAELLADPSVP